jgi:hypothetical protein
MKMYFLVYHAQPQPGLKDAKDIGGAYVSCWIEADSIDQADTIARQEIATVKWDVVEKEEAYEVNADDYSSDADGLELYQQALVDKWVLTFHTYPIEK